MKNKYLLSFVIFLLIISISSIQVSADGLGELVKLTDEQQEIFSLLRLRQTNFYSIDYVKLKFIIYYTMGKITK